MNTTADGDHSAVISGFFTRHYQQLRRMAERELRRGPRAALDATSLLHETFLEIAQRPSLTFGSCAHFMSYAVRAMRGLIVDDLRKHYAQKRGGGARVAPLPIEPAPSAQHVAQEADLEKLSEALQSLASLDRLLAQHVQLRFYWGLSVQEIARIRNVSKRTVLRDWDKARVLLHCLLNEADGRCGPALRPAARAAAATPRRSS
jgi:RNA polymerase sigma factor (TIGR02999 family)